MKSEGRNELPGFCDFLQRGVRIYRKRFGTVVGISAIACGLALLGVMAWSKQPEKALPI